MEGLLTLVSLDIPKQGLVHRDDGMRTVATYSNVGASFCLIAWDEQQANPAAVPMFKDLKKASPLCKGTTFRVDDFYALVRQAKQYDQQSQEQRTTDFAATKKRKGHQVVPIPTMAIFHESRCGSTLASNVLAARYVHRSC